MTQLDETHDPGLVCAVSSAQAADIDFPIQNLPFGVFRLAGSTEAFRGGVAIGDQIVDLAAALRRGWFDGAAAEAAGAACDSSLNRLAARGTPARVALRLALSRALREPGMLNGVLVPQAAVKMGVPMQIGDYTDFLANIEHAINAGRMFRRDQPILPNYRHVPIAYHGRASSIRPSGTPCIRPNGQWLTANNDSPAYLPSQSLDYELELGFYIGVGNELGQPIALDAAERHIFGLCLLNDWSARDIQRWEYQPLGPFLGKNFQSNVSPWIVTLEALAPFRTAWRGRADGEPPALGYLSSPSNTERGGFDVHVSASLRTHRMAEQGYEPLVLSHSNLRSMYWTLSQMLAHHTGGGCNMQPGDLVGTGTISATDPRHSGCLLEITRNGQDALLLPTGESRTFLADGDEVILSAYCEREGFRRIGFGTCGGAVLPAIDLAAAETSPA
jgi:fumarylacetoacetase